MTSDHRCDAQQKQSGSQPASSDSARLCAELGCYNLRIAPHEMQESGYPGSAPTLRGDAASEHRAVPCPHPEVRTSPGRRTIRPARIGRDIQLASESSKQDSTLPSQSLRERTRA